MEQVQRSYNTIFPSLLGLRLSNRIKGHVFRSVMEKLQEVRRVDEARAKIMLKEMSNKLKGDNFKKYETDFHLLFRELEEQSGL